jgi:ketosteroid isomerase-like protein
MPVLEEMNMNHRALPVIGLVLTLGALSCTTGSEPQAPAPQTVAASAPVEDVEAIITQLEKDWVAAIQKKDTAVLDHLLAVEFAGTSPTAHTYTKADAIADIKDSRYVVEKMDLDEVSVNVYGTTAVSFTSQEEKSKYAGKDTSGHYHFTDVWVKKDGQWQAVASQGTRYDKRAASEKGKEK